MAALVGQGNRLLILVRENEFRCCRAGREHVSEPIGKV
jgi:hypothetical protein